MMAGKYDELKKFEGSAAPSQPMNPANPQPTSVASLRMADSAPATAPNPTHDVPVVGVVADGLSDLFATFTAPKPQAGRPAQTTQTAQQNGLQQRMARFGIANDQPTYG